MLVVSKIISKMSADRYSTNEIDTNEREYTFTELMSDFNSPRPMAPRFAHPQLPVRTPMNYQLPSSSPGGFQAPYPGTSFGGIIPFQQPAAVPPQRNSAPTSESSDHTSDTEKYSKKKRRMWSEEQEAFLLLEWEANYEDINSMFKKKICARIGERFNNKFPEDNRTVDEMKDKVRV